MAGALRLLHVTYYVCKESNDADCFLLDLPNIGFFL